MGVSRLFVVQVVGPQRCRQHGFLARIFGIRPERGRDGRTGRTGRTDGPDGRAGRTGRTGRTDGIQFYITTGTEKYSFAVLLGRRNTVFEGD